MRVYLRSSTTTALTLDNVSIVERQSGADGTETPTEIMFSGTSGVTIPANDTVASDWTTFDFDEDKDYLVIMDSNTGNMLYVGSGGGGMYYKAATDSYDQQTVTGFTLVAGNVYCASKIEVQPAPPRRVAPIFW